MKKSPLSITKLAASAAVAGALCLIISPANAQTGTAGVASAEEVSRIRNEIRQRDAQLGIRRSYDEVTREAMAIADKQQPSAQAPAAAPAPATPYRSDYNYESPASRTSGTGYANYQYADDFETDDIGTEKTRFGVFVGPSVFYFAPGNENWDSDSMFGASGGFSATFGGHHYFSIETGFYGTDDYSAKNISDKIEVAAIPTCITYNYIFNLTPSKSLRLRLGPTIGLTYFKAESTNTYYVPYYGSYETKYSDSATSLGAGAVIGLRWEIGGEKQNSPKWFFEISERVMVSSELKFDIGSTEYKSDTVILGQTTVAVGVTF